MIRYTGRGWRLYEKGSEASRAVGERWRGEVGSERYEIFEQVLKDVVGTMHVTGADGAD